MGKANGQGIIPRKSSIQIYFKYNGQYYKEALRIPPTPANLKYAETTRKEILRKIEIGTFDFKEYFPDSSNVAKTDLPTLNTVAEEWLDFKKRELTDTTLMEYRRIHKTYFMQSLGNLIFEKIRFSDISKVMSNLPGGKKTFNNNLSVLKCIYDYGIKAGYTNENQAAKFDFMKRDEPKPDPLNQEQIQMILEDMRKFYPEQVEIYFALAFRIGFRPSEGIDLRWKNIDWEEKTLLIDSAKVRSRVKKPKTNKSRVVELDDYCMALLSRLKKHTFMVGEHLFTYTPTGKPHNSTRYYVAKYWRPTLKRCGIRERDARQTRHTCASIMLMAGCKFAWAAGQLGHSVDMFLRTYSKWIPNDDGRREMGKLSGIFENPMETRAQKN